MNATRSRRCQIIEPIAPAIARIAAISTSSLNLRQPRQTLSREASWRRWRSLDGFRPPVLSAGRGLAGRGRRTVAGEAPGLVWISYALGSLLSPGARVVLGVEDDRSRRPSEVRAQRGDPEASSVAARAGERLADVQVVFGGERLREDRPAALDGRCAAARAQNRRCTMLARGDRFAGAAVRCEDPQPAITPVEEAAAIHADWRDAGQARQRPRRAGL